MPDITFSIEDEESKNLVFAIEAFNVENPRNIAIDANDFSKKATLEAYQVYLTRHRNSRIAEIAEQIATCPPNQWAQVTSFLLEAQAQREADAPAPELKLEPAPVELLVP